VATDLPTNYEFNSAKISRALNHSTVKLSWDQTDPNRAAKLQQNYKDLLKSKDGGKFDDDDNAYDGLIAGSSSDNSEEMSENGDAEGNARKNQAKIDEMRRRLLGGISEDKPRRNNHGGEEGEQFESDDEVSDGQKEELQVNFGIGFGEDIGKKLLEKKQERKDKERMGEFQKWQEKRKEKRREKKQTAKDKALKSKKQGKMSEKEVMEMSAEEKR